MLVRFYKKYERRLSLVAFLTGFTIDNLTLTRIDLWLDNIILASYLILAALGITVYQLFNRRLVKGKTTKGFMALSTLLIQFAFGGLFSGYFVFYSKSASLVTSWWFVLLIILFLIGNELFKEKYARLEYQISIFFITLFSFAIFYLPIIVNQMGVWVFVLSGLVSLFIIRFFVRFLALFIPESVEKSKHALRFSILSIYIVFNVFYFTNIIPPIPLALKDSSIHHFVERQGDVYVAESEIVKWYEFGKKFRPRIDISQSQAVYAYSSVFAPTDLNVEVFHSWQYRDDTRDEWVETDRFSYPILGGRDGGFRGYTQKSQVFPGEWRVDVVTDRNQIIGRIRFHVEQTGEAPLTVSEIIR